MKKMNLFGMIILILSTAFIGCGKITNDPDPKKEDSTSASLNDSVMIEVTVKTSSVTSFNSVEFGIYNSALSGGYSQQSVAPSAVFVIKFAGKDATALIGKNSRIGLLIIGTINGYQCQWKLLNSNADTDNLIPITLKKGMNKVTFEYETWLIL
ncbi:MAG: hypothetical protein WC467_03575 [Patescibacteria group bacterium]